VLAVSEAGGPTPYTLAAAAASQADAGVAPPPVSPGKITVSASVTVIYRIAR
jgi:uncharacterized protein YggE